jgi:2-hydroxy-6-oxonona-2,4-dienedioate hydrolase
MTATQDYFSRFVLTGRYQTHYIECGDGEPVVMVYGGGPGASGEFGWRNNITSIGRYGRGIAIDMLGFGLSDKPAEIEYSPQALVRHLSAFIDALCLEQVNLVGNSLGAYVVAKYALDNPDRVRKLLLVGSGTIATAMGLDPGMTPGLQRLANYDGTKESLRGLIQHVMLHHPERITEEQVEKRHQQAQLPGVMEAQQSFLNYLRNRRKEPNQAQLYDMRHRLPQMTIPILFIWGEYDTLSSPVVAEQLETFLPNARFIRFKDSGHVVQNDEPERFNSVALEFFFNVADAESAIAEA